MAEVKEETYKSPGVCTALSIFSVLTFIGSAILLLGSSVGGFPAFALACSGVLSGVVLIGLAHIIESIDRIQKDVAKIAAPKN